MKTRKAKAIRTVRNYGPDGESVAHIEIVDVVVQFPPNIDPDLCSQGYTFAGQWTLDVEREVPA